MNFNSRAKDSFLGAKSAMSKPVKAHTNAFHVCPNPHCKKTFKCQRFLLSHYNQSKKCNPKLNQHSDGHSLPKADLVGSVVDATNPDDSLASEDNDFGDLYDDMSTDSGVTDHHYDENDINMDNESTASFCQFVREKTHDPVTTDLYFEFLLLKLLSKHHCPHELYSDIMQWARHAFLKNFTFNPTTKDRKSLLNKLVKWQGLDRCKPKQIPIVFDEDGLEINVTAWDFAYQFQSLICDQELTHDLSLLNVNLHDPFSKYKAQDKFLSCFNSGKWYDKAWNHLIDPHMNEWLCPIIFACDETLVGSHLGRASMTPLLFTLSIFSLELRNKPTAWRPLGYIHDLKQYGKGLGVDSKGKEHHFSKDQKANRYHKMLSVILASYVKVQQEGGLKNFTVQLGPHTNTLTIKVPCALLIGDMQGGDKHCGSSIGYSDSQKRLCRQCDVHGQESGNPLVKCNCMSMFSIKQLVASNKVEMLNEICQYNVSSAWFDVDFGGCHYGIFSAGMPVEALHALEGGLIKDILTILFNEDLTELPAKKLDNGIIQMTKWEKQHYVHAGTKTNMPRTLFKDGVSNLSKMPCRHFVGMMLSILMYSLTDDGKAFFIDHFAHKHGPRANKRYRDMQYLFSMTLAYWAWLQKDCYWQIHDNKGRQLAHKAIQTMLKTTIDLWPREHGQGWNKAKVHEQLHIPRDIVRNGCPHNTYAGPIENHHIVTKLATRRTQKHREVLDKQTGDRIFEHYVINHVDQRLNHDQFQLHMLSTKKNTSEDHNASKATIKYKKLGYRKLHVSWQWTTKGMLHGNKVELSKELLDGIGRYVKNLLYSVNEQRNCLTVDVSTEIRRGDTVFRAHPNYRGSGPWYDWAMFRYEKSELDIRKNRDYRETSHVDKVHWGDDASDVFDFHYAPGKLLGFVTIDEVTMVVVKQCSYRHISSGVFSTYWKIEYEDRNCTRPCINLMDMNAIVRHCCMVPEGKDDIGYHEVWDPKRWPDTFCVVSKKRTFSDDDV